MEMTASPFLALPSALLGCLFVYLVSIYELDFWRVIAINWHYDLC